MEADKVSAAAKKAKRSLTPDEAALVARVVAAADQIVQVDSFEKLGSEKFEEATYIRPALRGTKFAKVAVGARV